MDSTFFIKGLIFGFTIALPVGPIGILCMRRSLLGGWPAGLLTGLGAATADAFYGAVAGFGLAGIADLLTARRSGIQIFGGLFLCYLSVRIFRTPSQEVKTEASLRIHGPRGYFSALILTLTNPMTILAFTAVFAGMGLGNTDNNYGAAFWLVAGVFFGSMAWWLILSTITARFNTRLSPGAMAWINRLSGSILAGFGLLALAAGI
jgi:threonine/homoserine/homoserine lactone efflux protein